MDMSKLQPPIAWGRILFRSAVVISFIVLVNIIFLSIHRPHDWELWFRPAALMVLHGQSPYNLPLFFSPPWLFILLIPLSLLPAKIGSVLVAIANPAAYGFVAHKLGAKPWVILAILMTPQICFGVYNPNFDWVVALGLLMPPEIGLFFVLVKPQIGIAVALFWLVEAWRTGKFREIVRVFWPISITFLASLFIFGIWPLHSLEVTNRLWNISLWPYSIPFGLVLFYFSIRLQKINLSITASPFVTPYLAGYSLPLAILGLLPSQAYTLMGVGALWIIYFTKGLPW
jgi:hypothetical protein